MKEKMKEKIILSVLGQKEELTLDFSNKQLREVLCVCFSICLEKAYFSFDSDLDEIFSPENYLPYMDFNQKKLETEILEKIITIQPNEILFEKIDYTLIDLIKNIFSCAIWEEANEGNLYSSLVTNYFTPLGIIAGKYKIDLREEIPGLSTNLSGKLNSENIRKLTISVS